MKRFISSPIVILIVLAAVISAGWLWFMPGKIGAKLQQAIELQTGRVLSVNGGTHLVFAPSWGVALQDVTLPGASAMAEPVLKAKKIIIPVSLLQLVTGQINTTQIVMVGADISVALNGQGHANVLIEPTPDANKADVDAKPGEALQVKIMSGTFHFSDVRNGNEFLLSDVSADVVYGENLSVRGLALIGNQRLAFDAGIGSMTRAFGEGSPLDLNVEGLGSSFSFTGRVATTGSLGLAGQATLESADAQRLFAALGARLEGLEQLKRIYLSGVLDSQGSTFSMTKSHLKLGEMNAEGDISFSSGNDRPAIVASLAFDQIDLHVFEPAAAAMPQGWSEQPFSLRNFAAIDAAFQVSAKSFTYGPLTLRDVMLSGMLKDRNLKASVKGNDTVKGNLNVDIDFQSQQLPPTLKLKFDLAGVEAERYLAVVKQKWMSGLLTLNADVMTTGESQAAMVSALSGYVDVGLQGGKLSVAELSDISSAKARFEIRDGIVTLNENDISGSGEIDLLRRALAVKFTHQSQVLQINGPWDAPKISTIAQAMQ